MREVPQRTCGRAGVRAWEGGALNWCFHATRARWGDRVELLDRMLRQMGGGFSGALLERGGELEILVGALNGVRAGGGGVVVVEGPAGIGKSSLLDACAVEAEQRGVGVLRVRGDRLVADSSLAAVRELFWRRVRDLGMDRFEGASRLALAVFEAEPGVASDRDRASAVLHGLYWLTADLADRGPLVLLVDDAQWLDSASARFVVYLARRIDALPVLLVVALRAGEQSTHDEFAGALAELAARVLRPSPLSEEASGQIVRGVLGARAGPDLCRSCHEATRGNPFYLRELASALDAEGGRPTVELAERVRVLGVEAIRASVLVRLAHLGHDCERLAEALAVLGGGSSLRHVAMLAGVDRDRARDATDWLSDAEILSAGATLSFVHPIVSEAIESQLPAGRRAALHGVAARLLAAEGAPTDRVAAHLLLCEPYGERWTVDALRLAAQEALVCGAPDAAVSYLRRALAEPPPRECRLELLTELGRAEALVPIDNDFAALREALALAADQGVRAKIGLTLALALCGAMRSVEGRAVIDQLLERADQYDSETIETLEQALIGAGLDDLAEAPRIVACAARYFGRAARGEVHDPRMLAVLANAGVYAGMQAVDAAFLARRALADERLPHAWLDEGYVTAGFALGAAEALGEAAAAAERGIAEAQRRGSVPMLLQLALVRSEAAFRAGELDVAEDYAERAIEFGRVLGAGHIAVIRLPAINLERGRLERAIAVAEAFEVVQSTLWGAALQAERGRARIATGNLARGLEDLLDASGRMTAAGFALSIDSDWVPTAVHALTRLGRQDEAGALAREELDQARMFGAPRRHGIALSACGTLEPGPDGLDLLREAVEILERSPARLEHVRALVNLGVGLRARDDRLGAREVLAQALDLAYRQGAWALAERARVELLAGGARPRRPSRSGPEALTPAESRAARMAADGLSNREIAQALFVSTKTIEGQLSQAYAKLAIRSRADLPRALGHDGRSAARDRPAPRATPEDHRSSV